MLLLQNGALETITYGDGPITEVSRACNSNCETSLLELSFCLIYGLNLTQI